MKILVNKESGDIISVNILTSTINQYGIPSFIDEAGNRFESDSFESYENIVGASVGDSFIGNTLIKSLVKPKADAIEQVKSNSIAMAPVTINDITYNGGDSSASAISGAIQLAQNLVETDVKLWDVNNTIRTYTFEEAQAIAAQIAKAYRDAKYSDYVKIEAINACATVAELEAIEI